MPRTATATRSPEKIHHLASAIADIVFVFGTRIASELPRQVEALEVPASDPQGGRLCIRVSRTGAEVALRTSMPSDEELSEAADQYSFWFGLPPEVEKSLLLARLQPPAFENLATIQVWVWAVNKALMDGHPPHSSVPRNFTDLIDREAAAFRAFVTASPRTEHADRGGSGEAEG
jgi:hypothetical protein